ncbi:MAG: nucleotide sugar dehydrogenase [Candidatus Methanomethyliaceae archaeon]|nr:nucleotide sugar dehydrogenase [Candidatus Methanomethyliaceae archaeon]
MGVLGRDPSDLKKDLAEGKITVAIYGMGRVGLPIAVAWLRAGARVIGVDINHGLVKTLNEGRTPLEDEPGINEWIKKGVEEAKFYSTSDGIDASRKSDIKIVVVPTTLNSKKRLDNTSLITVAENIGKGLKRGDVVILECTVPPLTTENLIKPILEKESGLIAETDFGLAYSPERIYEGRALQDIEENYPKVVGGVGPRSTEAVASLYESIARKGVIRLKSPREAEASKVFEGIYRDVNIALANEFAKFCNSAGIDFMEARKAANSQPFCHIHLPGIGVGGLCIPIYPYFLIGTAEEFGLRLTLTRSARRINEGMPLYTLNLLKVALKEAGIRIREAKVGVLGLSFRGAVKDTRLSPALAFINLIKGKVASVKAYDPWVPFLDGVETCSSLEGLVNWSDALVVATDHPDFKEIDLRNFKKRLVVVDGRNILDPALLPERSIYIGIGRGSRNRIETGTGIEIGREKKKARPNMNEGDA